MRKIILLCIVVLINLTVLGQTKITPTTIILENNKELKGEMKFGDWIITPKFIEFKAEGETEYKKYTPEDINSVYSSEVEYKSNFVFTDRTPTEVSAIIKGLTYDSVSQKVFL